MNASDPTAGQQMCAEAASRPVFSDHVTELLGRNRLLNARLCKDVGDCGVRSVGVVGAGFMGSSVAAAAVEHALPVVVTDKDERVLSRAPASIAAAMEAAGVRTGRPAAAIARLVRTTTDLADVARCALVVESVIEDPVIKRQIFGVLEDCGNPDTIITSNTSTLPVEKLASELRHPARFCGLHFFPHFGERPMLEIIPGPRTSEQTTAAVVAFSEALDRIPLVVPDGRGFIVNCLFMAYTNAGLKLLPAGEDPIEIERAAWDFGMRVGPLALIDLIGLDVALNSGFSLAADSDALVARSPVLVRLIKARHLGCKTGAGFFLYNQARGDDPLRRVNPKAAELIARTAEGRLSLSPRQRTDAIVLPMVIEATRLLEAGRARSAEQIDLAAIFGFGFPTSRGGLLHWADQVGADRIVETLASLAHLGPHLHPTPLLRETARRGGRFYDL